MAFIAVVPGSYLPSELRRTSAALRLTNQQRQLSDCPPLYFSTNPTHLNLLHLQQLYSLCNYSCHRFPKVDSHGRVDPVDVDKLRTAVSHSSVVVSVFTRPEFDTQPVSQESRPLGIGGDLIRRVMMPVSPEDGRLVGFGRAVSDCGLTASIHDIMVNPDLQGKGIGRKILQQITRMLANQGVYDISALCCDKERPFFKACGFGNDILGSTTMIYTRTASGYPKEEVDQIVTCAGRKLLLVPQERDFSL